MSVRIYFEQRSSANLFNKYCLIAVVLLAYCTSVRASEADWTLE